VPVEGAEGALFAAAADPAMRLAAIDALEKMRTTAARDRLADLAEEGDLRALRALARAHDDRSREPLLALTAESDAAAVREGVDGLRDLRTTDPAVVAALRQAVRTAADASVVVMAAHALLMTGALEPDLIDALHDDDRPGIRRFAEIWLSPHS
jgi:hypothetical protein